MADAVIAVYYGRFRSRNSQGCVAIDRWHACVIFILFPLNWTFLPSVPSEFPRVCSYSLVTVLYSTLFCFLAWFMFSSCLFDCFFFCLFSFFLYSFFINRYTYILSYTSCELDRFMFVQVLNILCGSDEVLGSAAGRTLLQRCLSDVFSYGKFTLLAYVMYCMQGSTPRTDRSRSKSSRPSTVDPITAAMRCYT